jgi:MerR family transcriptional regulator, light-induced transcriptional regulator
MESSQAERLRIGELSRRVGLSPELLRAWEQRYGLLRPARSAGGLRLYSQADEQRLRAMQAELDRGLSAAEAARVVLARPLEPAPDPTRPPLDGEARAFAQALNGMDLPRAHAALDRLLSTFLLETVIAQVLLPYLRELGERWGRGQATIAQEHLASNLVRGRLLALARGWERGDGRAVLLACAPGELHDLPLIMFGLAMRNRGWRVAFLGGDTPVASLVEACERLDPALVVVSCTVRSHLRSAARGLSRIARDRAVAVAGGGASERLAEEIGCWFLAGDPVGAAGTAGDLAGPWGPRGRSAGAVRSCKS